MSDDKNHTEELNRYLSGNMSPEEAHSFERRTLDDPFLQDAIEGAEQIGAEQFQTDLKEIDGRLNKRENKFYFWRIAASIALLALVGWSAWYFVDFSSEPEVAYSKNEDKKEDVAPPTVEEEKVIEESVDESRSDQRMTEGSKEPKPVVTKKDEEDAVPPVRDREPVDEVSVGETALADADLYFAEEDEVAEERVAEEAAGFIEKPQPVAKAKRAAASRSYAADSEAVPEEPSQQSKIVTGTVTDDFGEILPQTAVQVKGTDNVVYTDSLGRFETTVSDISDVLQFSAGGMLSQEITVGNRNRLQVKMLPDEEAMQDVVVSGYGAFDNESEGFHGAYPVGGHEAYSEYLDENVFYPEEAIGNEIEGRVILQLTISPIGTITDIEVKRSLGFGCDEEAIRLVRQGPRWMPATRDGINIETKVRVRIKFELE